MPCIRLAIAAALTVALVLPATASAQTPAPDVAQLNVQIHVLKVGVDVRNQQLNAFRTQIALFRNTAAGAVIAAALKPQVDALVSANQRAQKQIDELSRRRALLLFATEIKNSTTQMAGIVKTLDEGKTSAETQALRAQLESLQKSSASDLDRLKSMMDKQAESLDVLMSMMREISQAQAQAARG
jgi:flagellar biosynthesis regulator FlbT